MIIVRLLSSRAFMVGFGTTKLTRVWEPALLWNQFHSKAKCRVRKGKLGHYLLVQFIDESLVRVYNSHMKSYEGDYRETTAALEALLRKREQIDAEIESFEERLRALETLIRISSPDKDRLPAKVDPAVVVVTNMKVTERVRGLLMASNGPLTSG